MSRSQVLIIEDDKESADYLGTILNMMDFEVETAFSAKEALSYLTITVPSLILLDMRLGREIGGEDILYQVRSNPRFDQTKVIVVTGYPTTIDMVSNLADLVLVKPVPVDLLQTLVSRISSYSFTPKRLSFRDPVTMLFHKDFFLTRLELAYERSQRREDFRFGMLIFEVRVDGSTDPEVSLEITNAILQEMAERLKKNLRPTDTVARVSTWKFAILLEDLKKDEDISVVTDRLQSIIAQAYQVQEKCYELSVKLGGLVNSRRYKQPVDLYAAAEEVFGTTVPNEHPVGRSSPSYP